MDDIYGDLENYNDANISELLNENKLLKSRLEEYSSSMNQLQKDFDKLNSEYKKLEVNYSSLLKTAKAEIERKTSMITQLNIEKDMLVINAIKKDGRINLRGRPNIQLPNAKYKYDRSTETSNRNRRSNLRVSPHDNERGGINKSLPSDKCSPIDSISSIGTVKSTSNEDERKKDSRKYEKDIRDDESKNLHTETHLTSDNSSNVKPNTIMDRRKSMPVLRKQDSSDENMLDFEKAKDKSAIVYTRHDVRKSSRHHESSRDKNKIDEKKNRDKFKSRRNSPERNTSRISRSTADEPSNRLEYRRQRVLESPPSNKYNRSRSRDHRSEIERRNWDNRSNSRDRRIEIERRNWDNRSKSPDRRIQVARRDRDNRSKSREFRTEIEMRDWDNRSKSRERVFEIERRNQDCQYYQQQQYPNKNRKSDFEEYPSNKRRRTEAYDIDSSGWRSKIVQENPNLQTVKACHTTCQSPDYDHIDCNFPQHYVREILHTATAKLDDPRTMSEKYVLTKQDGKPSYNRVAAHKVDIKQVNKTIWGIENVDVPEALKRNPLLEQNSDNILSEIYMDIENPSSNRSLELGQLKSLDDEECSKMIPQTTSSANFTKREKNHDTLKVPETTLNKLPENNEFQVLDNTKSLSRRYKIPKVRNRDSETDSSNIKLLDNDNIRNDPRVDRLHKTSTLSSLPVQSNKQEEILLTVERHVDNDFVNLAKTDQCRKALSVKDIERDLELSDEEDGVEFHNKSVIQLQSKTDELKPLPLETCLNEDTKHIQELVVCTDLEKKNVVTEKKKTVSKKKVNTDSVKESKKHKSKKSRQDHKNTKVPLDDQKQTRNNTDDKCERTQIKKNKFGDLFGDSNSLITPGELGIEETEIPAEKFTSEFDDNQDAVDLNIEELEKLKKNLKSQIDNKSEVSDKTVMDQNFTEQQINKNMMDLNCEALQKNATVVKTVIISTGVQPGLTESTAPKDQRESLQELGSKNNLININPKSFLLDSIKALATSTPLKVHDVQTAADASSNFNILNTLPPPNPSSDSNTSATKSEADAPDMRIFVKRRRKIKKP